MSEAPNDTIGRRRLILEDSGLHEAVRAYGDPAALLTRNPFIR